MLSVKRLILPLLLLIMLSSRMVYAEPPPAEADETAAPEASDCSGLVSSEAPGDAARELIPAGSDNEEGMTIISDDACSAAAGNPDAGGGSGDFAVVNAGAAAALRGSAKSEKTGSLIIYCNVRGSLGDLSKRFAYTLNLSGLETDTEYEVLSEDADLCSGFSEDGFESDSEGKALLHFCLADESCIIIRELPLGTAFDVCEKANDHKPEYLVHEVKSIKKSGSGPPGADLSTGEVKMTYSGGNYTVDFNNSRELAPVTGLPQHGPSGETTQLITGFALITVLIILCTKSRRMHIIIDMNITDVLESSE